MGIFDSIINELQKRSEVKKQFYEQSGQSGLAVHFNKGVHGEFLTYKELSKVPGYSRLIANCYIPKEDGTSTEIDMIMVHETGVYVIESKNYSGYIFGSANQKMWTQTLPSGNRVQKNQFYNPIWQNRAHINYLSSYLYEDVPFFSYIVFSQRCSLKKIEQSLDSTVRVVKRNDLYDYLFYDVSQRGNKLSTQDVDYIFNTLDSLSHTDRAKKVEHVKEIKEKGREIKEKLESGICPKCGGKLVLRTVKNGAAAGKRFYGCSNYPKCKFTKQI